MDKKWLREMYVIQRLSLREIAKRAGQSASTVKRWVEYYRLSRPAIASSPRPDRSTLIHLRDSRAWSAQRIAHHYRVRERTVHKWFEFYGLEPPGVARRQRANADQPEPKRPKTRTAEARRASARKFSQAMPTTDIISTSDETLVGEGYEVQLSSRKEGWFVRVMRQRLGPFETRHTALIEAATLLWDRGQRAAADALVELANSAPRRGSR